MDPSPPFGTVTQTLPDEVQPVTPGNPVVALPLLVPTRSPGDATLNAASTAFVAAAIVGLGGGTPAAGSITLAMLADLAQDQFIGRTTASTGVPQTATITAAARTVLDDAVPDVAAAVPAVAVSPGK